MITEKEDREFLESVYRNKGLVPPPMMPKKPKEKDMNKKINDTLKLFDEKKISNVKENISMTIVDGKLSVLNLVTFDLIDNTEEAVETSFFASADSKDDILNCAIYLIIDSEGIYQNPKTNWIKGIDKVNLETYPEEMIEVISKSINSNYNIASKFEKDNIERFNNYDDILNFPEFNTAIDNTNNAYKELMSEVKKFKALSGSVNLEDFLDRYFFKKHILVQGEKGGGKTFAVHKMLKDRKVPFEEIDGHEGIEAIDLLGYYLKDASGNMVWMDGVLTKAFRSALTKPTVLFVDEVLRIPSRELNILVGALAPMSDSTYTLRTNRIVNMVDGVGESEYLAIPVENLWCVGTTNVGAGYQVDDIDDALADRFRTVIKHTSNSELETILNIYATEKKMNLDIVPKMVEFYTQMRDFMVSGEIEKIVNTRHLCEVLQLADDVSEVKSYMFDLIPTWTTMDTNGNPNKAERDIITKLIKKIIK